MQPSIMTEQLLAIRDDAERTLAAVKTESRREMVRLWEEAAANILQKILTNLESIESMDANVFADWLDKYRILQHFLSIAARIKDEAKDG